MVATAYGRIAYVAGAAVITSRRLEDTIKRKNLNINGVPVSPAQAEVHRVLSGFPEGLPDHALVPLAQHVSGLHLSSSGVRTRRKELTDVGLVKSTRRTVTTASGRPATVWRTA